MANSSQTSTDSSTTSTEGFVGEARINPKTGKPAGLAQGALLLAVSALPILGAVLVAPNLAIMTKAFEGTPGVEALVPLVLVIPAIFIAIFAPIAGFITDKLGRKRVLLTVLVVYAVLGTAPLWIPGLPGIVASRAGVGIVEAFIITSGTALIADYFSGGRRNRYLGLQAVVASLSATLFLILGGALGSVGWRTPFWMYLMSIPIAILVFFVIWPTLQNADGSEKTVEKLPRLPIRPLIIPVIVTLFGGVVFYVFIVELSFILEEHGIADPKIVGAMAGLTALSTAVGALFFKPLARFGARAVLTASFAVAGAGFLIVALAPIPNVPIVLVGACISSFATGVLLPTLIVWAIARLPYEQRGRGTGAFASSLFVGEFFCPIIVLALTAATGTLNNALVVVAIISLVVAVAVALVVRSKDMANLAS